MAADTRISVETKLKSVSIQCRVYLLLYFHFPILLELKVTFSSSGGEEVERKSSDQSVGSNLFINMSRWNEERSRVIFVLLRRL